MNYHFKVHREKSGFWAECIELKGLQTQGDNMTELKANMSEALELYLEESDESDLVFKLPKKNVKGDLIEKITVPPRLALAVILRNIRKKNGLSQTKMGKLIGLNGLYSYQRLENPKTANPEWETLARIKKAFPEIQLDDLAA